MAKQKMREVTDENEALALLGINAPETPGGEAVSTVGLPDEQQAQQPVDTSAQEKVVEEVAQPQIEMVEKETEEQAQVSATQNSDGTITKDEEQRRSWQAEADRQKAENERLQQQIQMAQAQNQQLLGVVTPFMQKYNQPQTKEPEPEINYMEDGMFDPEKHRLWQEQRDKQLGSNITKQVMAEMKRQQEEQDLQQQLIEVANKYPDYCNPLTGQVDVDRLQNDLAAYTKSKNIVDLLGEMRGDKKAPVKQMLSDEESLKAIQRNANKQQSAVATSGSEAEKKEMPAELKKIQKTFGNNFDLPPDFGGIG